MATRLLRLSLFTLLLLLGCGAYGFVSFVDQVLSYQDPVIDDGLQSTEAVVVLTGGSERVATGLHLLEQGKAQKLLISGVHPSVKINALLGQDQAALTLKDCCIVLGHEADNTIGNALETSAFMREQGFHSLRLVTAHYHMPRSLMLFHDAMPDALIVPHPVSPDRVELDGWWHSPGTFSLLVNEYAKFAVASVRRFL